MMKRWFLAVTVAATAGVAALAQSQPATPWNIGDVFLGIGNGVNLFGTYRVFGPDGSRKTGPDLQDDAGGLTTACAIDPTVSHGNLYTTSWWTPVSTIPDALPHAPATSFDLAPTDPKTGAYLPDALPRAAGVDPLPAEVSNWEIESVVFDRAGDMYLGALEAPDSAYAWIGHGWIVKVSKPDPHTGLPTLLGWWQVDAGDQQDPSHTRLIDVHGADWIDLSNDETTIYYTSEDGYIRSFYVAGPNAGTQGPALVIRYTPDGPPLGSKPFALRILPPGDPANGFLVATGAAVYRVDGTGLIINTYLDPAQTGYFSLNITPDGASFWTATLNGYLYKFHIASGAMLGPFQTGVESAAGTFRAYGMCVKREFTASENVCFATDLNGNAIPDTTSPTGYRTEPCTLPPTPAYCTNHPQDSSCMAPPTPANRPPLCNNAAPSGALWPPNHTFVNVSVLGVSDPDGDRVKIAVNSIWQDEPLDVDGDGHTLFDAQGIGTATASIRAERSGLNNGRLYQINFTADDGKAGGTCTGSVLVGVPHDRGQQTMPVDNGARYDSITGIRIR